MTAMELLAFAMIGFLAGSVGGLLGIGGSVIFIPLATLVFGPDQQVYQAAAMILNAAVAASATVKHASKGALSRAIVMPMAVTATITVLIGVYLGNVLGGVTLARLFGVLLLILGVTEIRNLLRRSDEREDVDGEPNDPARHASTRLASIGGTMGLLGGLLGIGGGTIGVPLLRFGAGLPLRTSIATAAAVTLPLALVGAIYKNITLPDLPAEAAGSNRNALVLALAVVPTAIAGAFVGAGLVHRLPITAIRVGFVGLLLVAGIRMLTISA